MVLYLGPGDDSGYISSLRELLASPRVKAFGPEPEVVVKRVPHSEPDFEIAKSALMDALSGLRSDGYVPSRFAPDIQLGTYDVWFSSAPKGATAASTTALLQNSVSPLIQVISVRDATMIEYSTPTYRTTP